MEIFEMISQRMRFKSKYIWRNRTFGHSFWICVFSAGWVKKRL